MSRILATALMASLLMVAGPGPSARAAPGFVVRHDPLFSPREEAELDARLHADLDSLTVDHARGVYRSRHGRRVDTFVDALPFLERRLRGESPLATEFLPVRDNCLYLAVDRDCFHHKVSDTLSIAVCNLRAFARDCNLEGPPPRRPKVILCAHYDSDARLTGRDWHFESDPAPGADDNASGCAALLELARQVGTLRFPFDLEFQFFGGEEFGLFGSRHEAAAADARGDSILAVLSLDMLAYAPRRDSLFVVVDSASRWLADSLVGVSRRAWADGPALQTVVEARPRDNSDHAPYRNLGCPAAMLSEAASPVLTNPTTETLADTLGNLSMRAIRRAVQLVGMWLRELAAPRAVFETLPWGPYAMLPSQRKVLAAGDSLRLPEVTVRVAAGSGVDAEWELLDRARPFLMGWLDGKFQSRSGDVRTLFDTFGPVTFGPGARVTMPARTLPLGPAQSGSYAFDELWKLRPVPSGLGREISVESWSDWIELLPAKDAAPWELGPRTNPVGADSPVPAAYVRLRAGTPVGVRLFDAAGRTVHRAREAARDFAGLPYVPLAPAGRNLPAGVYFYRLELDDGRASHGRIVILR